jgi:MFS family permease
LLILQVVFCGMALGAGLYGGLGDAMGRKRTLMLSNLLLFISGMLPCS